MSLLVLTVIGPDRPGLVESIAEALTAHEGNWMESRMAHLGGKFAGILRVDVPAARSESFMSNLDQLREKGLYVHAETDVAEQAQEEFLSVRLELVGGDRPGIVKEISHALAGRGVNVEELNTECDAAAMTGKSLFRATAQLRLPPDLALDDLRHELEQVAHDLMVDVTLNLPQDG
jgi:glycine cleavage system regulatory protein